MLPMDSWSGEILRLTISVLLKHIANEYYC